MVREVRSSKRLQVLQDQKAVVKKSKPLLQKKASTSDKFLVRQIKIIEKEREGKRKVDKSAVVERGRGEGRGKRQDPSGGRRKKSEDPLPTVKGRTTRAVAPVAFRRNGKVIPQKPSVKNAKSTQKANGKQTKAKPSGNTRTTRPRLTKKVLSSFEEETLGIRPIDRGSSWDGNSDSLGSVNSGVLDENLCFHCGLETTEDDFGSTILCDGCDGEYHLTCVGLTSLPRITWTCSRCREERAWFANLKYEVPNFKVSNVLPPPPRHLTSRHLSLVRFLDGDHKRLKSVTVQVDLSRWRGRNANRKASWS
jgi:hypothetical protein